MGSPHWSSLLAVSLAPWRVKLQCNRFACSACDPMGDPRWSSTFLKDCTPWKGPALEQFVKNCSPGEAPTLEQFVEN